eukprot:TRINITY_DN1750_c0_g1_i18.p2 TRINITY_DN1750_c0_g1~~TRINITY_DN1750_c0_g1_i18.p2  ORF type:complete len:108 (+),score=33.83 TRINITY_DN1750_c0_g1_i18:91-414(+)
MCIRDRLKTDGNEEQGKRVYFKLIQAEIGKGGVKLPEFNLGEKEQNILKFYITEYLRTLTGHQLFGSRFPIPGLREPVLRITGQYVSLAGFNLHEDIDVDPEEEDVA